MTTTLQEVKLTAAPGQQFSTVQADKRIEFTFRYNSVVNLFAVNISINDERTIAGKMLAPEIDILDEYNLQIGNLWATDINGTGLEPSLENIEAGLVKVYLFYDDREVET